MASSIRKAALVLAAAAVTAGSAGCSGGIADVFYTQPAAAPTATQFPWPGCTVTAGGSKLFRGQYWLKLVCQDELTRISGDFRDRVQNDYDINDVGVRSAVVVDGEYRVFHVRTDDAGTPMGCLTVQRFDEVKPSLDECDPQRYAAWTKGS